MTWKVKFKPGLFEVMEKHLFSTSPEENGCFLVAEPKGKVLIIEKMILPKMENWLEIGEGICVPSPRYISEAILLADVEKKSLLFIHTHPEEFHPSSFSLIDEISNEALFNNLSSIIDLPLGSLVLSRKGIHGVIFSDGLQHSIESFCAFNGKHMRFELDAQGIRETLDEDEYNRQLLMMKPKESSVLSNLNIAIVGLGGIGSPLAVMLAKMGVGKLSFYDSDKVEKHNLPRIYGANEESIGKFKVEVVKDFVSSFSNCSVITNKTSIDFSSDLSEHDLIFGCVDNHTARDYINNQAVKYLIPLIDSACSIPMDEEGNVIQAAISLSTVMPNQGCLWCQGVLNSERIRIENLTDTELKSEVKDGYVGEIADAPSVISQTTAVASLAANRLLNLIGVYSEEYASKVMLDLSTTTLIESDYPIDDKCSCSL